jgi:hypothetical protein
MSSFFKGLGGAVSNVASFLGQKAKEAGQFIGDVGAKALPVISTIASNVSKYAPKVADVVSDFSPMAGSAIRSLGEGADFVSKQISSGEASNKLEMLKKTAGKVADIAGRVQQKGMDIQSRGLGGI